MKIARTAALAAVLAGVAAPAASAACTGTDSTVKVCLATVSPTGGTLYENCVVIATSPDRCIPVRVPGPSYEGPLVQEASCGACDNVPDLPNAGEVVGVVDGRLQPVVDNLSRMRCAPSRTSGESVETLDTLRDNVNDFVESCTS